MVNPTIHSVQFTGSINFVDEMDLVARIFEAADTYTSQENNYVFFLSK